MPPRPPAPLDRRQIEAELLADSRI